MRLNAFILTSRSSLLIFLFLVAVTGAGPGRAQEDPVGPDEAAGATDEDSGLTPELLNQRLRAARKTFENFQRAILEDDRDTVWALLSSAEQREVYGGDPERLAQEIAEMRADEDEWVIYRTMTLVDVEIDEDDPEYAYATVRYLDLDGEEDEDEVDLVFQGGRWRVEGYF